MKFKDKMIIESINENVYDSDGKTTRRTKEISYDDVLLLLKDGYDKQLRNQKTTIYRSINVNYDFGFISPNRFERKSRNTLNIYTLIIDNSPNWKSYPKRSRSVICRSSDTFSLTNRGYLIIPKNDAKIGVCPSFDMWDSFSKKLKGILLYEMNDIIAETVNTYLRDYKNEIHSSNLTYLTLLEIFRALDAIKDKIYPKNDFIKEYVESDMTFLEYIEDILDPTFNGFSLKSTGEFLGSGSKEVWTDSPCILIHGIIARDIDFPDNFLEDMKNK